MSTTNVPAKANPYFPKHKYHGIAIGQNLKPIQECRLHHYVGPAATVEKGIASYQLSAEHLWKTFQQEAEDLIKVNGKIIKKRHRAKQANQCGLRPAVAGRQSLPVGRVGGVRIETGRVRPAPCAAVIGEEQGRRQGRRELGGSSTEAAGMSAMPTVIRNGADYLHERLGFGNMHLFLDIYPLHRFYMERGPKEFDGYLTKRQAIARKVEWRAGTLLKFGFPFEEIKTGFAWITEGNLARSVEFLAWHEQANILQAIMYNDRDMQAALAKNQFAWAIGFPSGVYMEVQLTLSAQCKAKDGLTSYFSSLKNAKLWVVDERMKFVSKAAERFDELLRGKERPYVEMSLRKIAAGGGVE